MRFQSWYERIKDSKTLDFLKLSRENQSKERRIIEIGMVTSCMAFWFPRLLEPFVITIPHFETQGSREQ